MAYQPHLFIDIGETFAFYTLRETYQHEIWGRAENGMPVLRGTEERSFHLFNLSQESEAAYTKALDYSREQGLRLSTNPDKLQHMLRDIKRRNAEQMEEDARLERLATSRRNLGYAQDRDAQIMETIMRNGGIHNFSFGKHAGEAILKVAEIDREYIEFLLERQAEMNEDGLSRYDHSLLDAQMEHALEAVEPPPESEYFGTEGKRTNGIEATVKKIHRYYSDHRTNYYDSGERMIQTLITDAGEILILFSMTDMGDVGDRVRFNAMIKKHDEYRDVKQTTINRPTKVEHLEEK